MTSTLTISLFLYLPLNGLSLNLKNNACPRLEGYHIAPSKISGCYVNPDVLSDVPQMVVRHSYNVVTYTVTTDDGYILTLFKIFSKGKGTKNYSVFIQHGFATNSGPWVDVGNRSLAFYLADKGYEVWLGNVRGSTYSNKHVTLTVDDPEYWNFSLDTIAEKDMRTQLRFVFEQSKRKIHYIGHSMGTSLCLMVSSTFPEEVNAWLQSINLMAPVAYLNNVFLIKVLKIPFLMLIEILDRLNIRGLFYKETALHKFLTRTCKLLPELCYGFLKIAFGRTTEFPSEDLLLYFSYWPSGISIYQLKQFLQIANSKRFQKYDYGSSGNYEAYGANTPPVYNLKKVTVPTTLLYGENDVLYNRQNLERLFDELGSTNKYKRAIPSRNNPQSFDHINFMYAKYIITHLYETLITGLEQFES